MPSTYSASLGLELIGNGEQAGTWGTTTNNNLGTLLEQAITGVEAITLTGGDYTLTDYNGLPDQARNAVLVLNGLLGAPCNVIAPSVEKTYIVRNFSNATVTIKTAGGNGVSLTNAASAIVFCDGTNFYSATTLNYIDGNLTVTGTTNLRGAVTANTTLSVGGTTTLVGDVFCNSNTGQIYLPVGTDAQRTSTPTVGLMRYNTTGGFYEGWNGVDWQRFLTANEGSYVITYMIMGGGGGGSANYPGGGGGGGQYTASTTIATPASSVYTITIGAGGASDTAGSTSTITGVGQGLGGGRGLAAGQGGTSGNGYTGGGQGGAGGGGGGGGAAANGGGGSGAQGGAGGSGANTLITGVSTYFGGGGGGGGGGDYIASPGAGGAGGGGNGGSFGTASPGSVNTGGGGGGTAANNGSLYFGGAGGSGVVILSMPTINYTGTTTGSPTVTTSGSNTILTYTSAGTYTA